MRRRVLAAAIGVAAAVGCGGGVTAGSEDPYDFQFDDPPGDTTAAVTNPDSVRAIDLIGVSGRVDGSRLRLVLTFAEPVTRWSDGAANGLDGFVYFDVDRTSGTGRRNRVPPQVVGGDFYLDLRDDGSGRIGLVDVLRRRITVLTPRFSGTTFEVDIPRSAISTASDSDNILHLLVEIDARNRTPVGDVGPDADFYLLEPPGVP